MTPRNAVLPLLGFFPLLGAVLLTPYQMGVAAVVGSYAIASLAQNLLSGFAAVPSLGNVAFFATSAFVTGGLLVETHLPSAVAIALGIGAAGGLGLIVGIPSLRISGMHLAIVTVVLVFVVQEVASQWESGHPSGITVTTPGWLLDERGLYVAVVLSVWAAYVATWSLLNSRTGRAINALSENPYAATACGVNTTSYRLLAFVLSGVLTGCAGVAYLFWAHTVTPPTFSIALSLAFLTMMIVGGSRSLGGSLVGALSIGLLPEALRMLPSHIGQVDVAQSVSGVYALLLLAVLRFMPNGLWNGVSRLGRKFHSADVQPR